MYKTRTLPCDLGITNGFYDQTVIGGSYLASVFQNWKLPDVWDEGLSRLTAQITAPATLGVQMFESTTNPRPKFNSMSNYRTQFIVRPFSILTERYNRADVRDGYYCYMFNPSAAGIGFAALPIQLGGGWAACEGAQRRAWWSMQPRFEGEVEALNFIWELKDFRSIAKSFGKVRNIRRLGAELKKLQSTIRRELRKRNNKSLLENIKDTFDDVTRLISELRLTNEYCVKPTINDVGSILKESQVLIDDVQKKFQVRGQAPQRSYYSELIDSSTTWTSESALYYWRPRGYTSSLTFTATLEYEYDYIMRSYGDAFRRYYGLDVTGEGIWNAIPFSFLADYFVKIGQSIRNMAKDPNVNLMPIQYCESLDNKTTFGYHVIAHAKAKYFYCPDIKGSNPKTGTPIGEVPALITGTSKSHYLRRVTAPNRGSALPRVQLPTTGQIKNMMALLRVLW